MTAALRVSTQAIAKRLRLSGNCLCKRVFGDQHWSACGHEACVHSCVCFAEACARARVRECVYARVGAWVRIRVSAQLYMHAWSCDCERARLVPGALDGHKLEAVGVVLDGVAGEHARRRSGRGAARGPRVPLPLRTHTGGVRERGRE
eukprot:1601329-Pleurochrysis_carterae.AAC.1